VAKVKKGLPVPPKALLFELEYVAVPGRKLYYETLKSVLADKGIALTTALFSRLCVGRPARLFVPQILKMAKKERVSEPKLTEEVKQAMAACFAGAALKPNPALKKLMKAALDDKLRLGAVTCLDEGLAASLITQLGMTELGVRVLPAACDERHAPTVDSWLKLAKNLYVSPACCVAVGTTAVSCRAALAAHMRCVALLDAFTSFQDFGGCDYVVASLDEIPSADIFALLEPKS